MNNPVSPQRRLNIVIDVQDVHSEMDGPTQVKFHREFEDQISYLDEPKQKEMREKLAYFNSQSENTQENRDRYRGAIGEGVQTLRDNGVPTMWVAIGNSSRLYPANEPRDPRLLNDLQLTRLAPRPDEDIFQKRYMSAVTDIGDFIQNGKVVRPELHEYLNGQRPDQKSFHEGILNGSIAQNDYFSTPTFRQHLKKLAPQEVGLMGQMTEYCMTDNSMSLAMEGYKVKVFPGLVAPDRQTTWSDTADHYESQKAKIETALDKIVADPQSRGYRASDAAALKEARQRIEFVSLPEYVASLSPAAIDHTPSPSLATGKGTLRQKLPSPEPAADEGKSAGKKTTTPSPLAGFDA